MLTIARDRADERPQILVALAAVFGGVAALPAVFVLLIFAAAIYLMINSRNLRRPPDTRA